jgi:Tol biopolymer transport system component
VTASVTIVVNPILFAGNPDGTGAAIFAIDPDGQNRTRLTSVPGAINPSWSPERTRIAFQRWSGATDEVWVMNADGSGETRLTDGAFPDWSPDGSRIAFHLQGGLYLIDAPSATSPGGTNLTRLVSSAAFAPAWSPDGRRLAFGCDSDVCVIDADGQNQAVVTGSWALSSGEPSWSPDGRHIALLANPVSGGSEIFVIDADGQNPTQMTSNDHLDAFPAWSPDGSEIVFESDPNDATDGHDLVKISYPVPPGGNEETLLTTDSPTGPTAGGLFAAPAW